MAGVIKKYFPHASVFFLGRTYTKDIIALSEHVDGFINYDEVRNFSKEKQIEVFKSITADVIVHVFPTKELSRLAKEAGIPLRVGTTNRLYHWFTCNKLIRLSRKNSDLHESQLNLKLLGFFGISESFSIDEIHKYYGFTKLPALENPYRSFIDKNKINVILHPKSKGSAKEWGLANFSKLIELLPDEKYSVFISGTAADGVLMRDFLKQNENVTNLTGKLNLQQFIAFINECDALVAASTGPLHIASALGKNAIGLFSPKRPIHPGRWMPLGTRAKVVVHDKNCLRCKNKEDCNCIIKIEPERVFDLLNERVKG
jgi:heptosyltransferase III